MSAGSSGGPAAAVAANLALAAIGTDTGEDTVCTIGIIDYAMQRWSLICLLETACREQHQGPSVPLQRGGSAPPPWA